MRKNGELLKDIEKGFSKYVKSALSCTAHGYFNQHFKDIHITVQIDDFDIVDELNITGVIRPSNIVSLEEYLEDDLLSKAVSTLSDNEKEVLYMKFLKTKQMNKLQKGLELQGKHYQKLKGKYYVSLKIG